MRRVKPQVQISVLDVLRIIEEIAIAEAMERVEGNQARAAWLTGLTPGRCRDAAKRMGLKVNARRGRPKMASMSVSLDFGAILEKAKERIEAGA